MGENVEIRKVSVDLLRDDPRRSRLLLLANASVWRLTRVLSHDDLDHGSDLFLCMAPRAISESGGTASGSGTPTISCGPKRPLPSFCRLPASRFPALRAARS